MYIRFYSKLINHKTMDKVVHFEIPADNLPRAKKFYHGVFGWELTDVPGMDYTLVTTVATSKDQKPKEPGAINGGMLKRSKDYQSPVIVINVPSVDAYLKKIEKAGGKVVAPKHQVGDMGFYARVKDTEGNVIGIWQDIKR